MIHETASRINALCPLSGNERRLVIVIARKGPHFTPELEGMLENTDYVTEFALPFVNTSDYKNFVILDDAVYYGSTFKKVTRLLLSAIADKEPNLYTESGLERNPDIVALPMVVSSSSHTLKPQSFREGKIIELPIDIPAVNPAEEPFYINSVIDYIYDAQRPYDIEVPIFNFPFSGDVDRLLQIVSDSIGKSFNVPVPSYEVKRYNRTSDRQYVRYSLVLDNVFATLNGLQPDFAKLRFLHDEKNNELLVCSFCTCAVDQSYLNWGLPIFPESFNVQVWQPLVAREEQKLGKARSVIDHPLYGECYYTEGSELLAARYEFDYQYRKTLAVMANWFTGLLLYHSLAKLVPGILQPISLSTIRLLRKNLSLLLGNEKAEETVRNIIGWLATPDGVVYSIFDSRQSLSSSRGLEMPSGRYGYAFETSLFDELKNKTKVKSVEDAMSVEFEMMHNKIELPSRLGASNVYNRLRFGESMPSLCSRFVMMDIGGGRKRVEKAVHKALDLRIDSGSAVPNFILQKTGNASSQWARVFRSGENEDYRIAQLRRSYLWMFKTVSQAFGSSHLLNGWLFDAILAISATRLQQKGIAKDGMKYLMGHDVYWHGDDGRSYLALSLEQESATVHVPLHQFALDQRWVSDMGIDNMYLLTEESKDYKTLGSLYTADVDKEIEVLALKVKEKYGNDYPYEKITSWLLCDAVTISGQLDGVQSLLQQFIIEQTASIQDNADYKGNSFRQAARQLFSVYNYVPIPEPLESFEGDIPTVKEHVAQNHSALLPQLNRCMLYLAVYCLLNYKFRQEEDAQNLLDLVRSSIGYQIYDCHIDHPVVFQGHKSEFFDWFQYCPTYHEDIDSVTPQDFLSMMNELIR